MSVFRSLILALILAVIGSMFYTQRLKSQAMQNQVVQVSDLLESGQGISQLALELDRFRDAGTDYRKMTTAEVKTAIDRTQARFKSILAKINRESLLDAEKKQLQAVDAKMDELIELSQKIVGYYNSPDPFRLAESRDAHAAVRRELTQLVTSVQARGRQGVEQSKGAASGSDARIFIAGGTVILLLLLSIFVADYVAYQRPLKKLHALALQFENGKAPAAADASSGLKGYHGKVASVMSALANGAERLANERHKFMLDLFSDFTVPLSMMRAGKSLGQNKSAAATGHAATDDKSQLLAVDTVKRGMAALSGSLDDLSDLAEFGNIESRLEERLIDLAEVVLAVSHTLTGPESSKWVTATLPPMPVWINIDARRLERVLTHVILKVAGTVEASEKIHVTVADTAGSGVEILIQGESRMRERSSTGSGPEVEITKHWVSEQGLFLGLMSRIIRVQGGSITASGVVGTSVQVRIRLPQERIVSHGLINAPRGLRVDLQSMTEPQSTVEQA